MKEREGGRVIRGFCGEGKGRKKDEKGVFALKERGGRELWGEGKKEEKNERGKDEYGK